MNFKLILRQEAEKDLVETCNWYNEKVPGLGSDFLAVVEPTLESIQANPARFPVVYRGIQRALLCRFPYGVFFVLEDDQITVLAVMHCARDPEKWRQP